MSGVYLRKCFRFIVAPNYPLDSPDTPIPWMAVEALVLTTECIPECPICLEDVSIPRAVVCGHLFCFSCISEMLSLGDTRCPMCKAYVDSTRLKPVVWLPIVEAKEGLLLEFVKCEFPKPIDSTQYDPMLHSQKLSCNALCGLLKPQLLLLKKMKTEHSTEELLHLKDRLHSYPTIYSKVSSYSTQSLSSQCPSLTKTITFKSKPVPDNSFLYPSKSSSSMDSPTASVSQTKKHYFQAKSGEFVFIDSLDYACLTTERPDGKCLSSIVLRLTQYKQTLATRKRYTFLKHLPVGLTFSFAEIDLSCLVGSATLTKFRKQIAKRRAQRLLRRLADHSFPVIKPFLDSMSKPKCILTPSLSTSWLALPESIILSQAIPSTPSGPLKFQESLPDLVELPPEPVEVKPLRVVKPEKQRNARLKRSVNEKKTPKKNKQSLQNAFIDSYTDQENCPGVLKPSVDKVADKTTEIPKKPVRKRKSKKRNKKKNKSSTNIQMERQSAIATALILGLVLCSAITMFAS